MVKSWTMIVTTVRTSLFTLDDITVGTEWGVGRSVPHFAHSGPEKVGRSVGYFALAHCA